ncbi:MAG: tRNA 2-thiouridine(34) synthase MnmA [Verrucomicrobia bacterium]|jgi:tRNA-uridine 2-sulfurtransferase|nr:tRNA 2-thiouridine(34) synthase MnmA [Verrucomicrobiota bacterium]
MTIETIALDPNTSGVVAVGMSGGVDSAVATALLVKQGYRVFGVTAKMTQEYSRCCADEDVLRAATMCAQLGIAHHVVDVCDGFQSSVIDPFMTSYLAGKTPSPCVDCNREIKFGILLERAMELGADTVATGHYVRLSEYEGSRQLVRGVDRTKDQSYFLSRLTQEQLKHVLFPLGEMQKREVSQLAADFDLEARKSRESQELCFVTEGTHGEWIDLRSLETQGPGDIVDVEGNILGQHRGVHHYTIGQRKGLGVAVGHPIFIIKIDAEHNRIVVGERELSMSRDVRLRDVQWSSKQPQCGMSLLCQVRYNHRAAPCQISEGEGSSLSATFDEPQFAITPGQLAVFYDEDRIVGSGWIC